jgi:hypothetical protein
MMMHAAIGRAIANLLLMIHKGNFSLLNSFKLDEIAVDAILPDV